MFKRVATLIVGLLALVAGAMVLWPQLFSLQRTNPFAFMVASRGADVAVAVVAIIAILVLGMLGKTARRLTRPLLIWLVIVGVASAWLVYQRGWNNTPATKEQGSALTVFTWNTLGGKPGADKIAARAVKVQADVVSLPETSLETGQQVATLMAAAGHPVTVLHDAFDDIYTSHSTVLLISTDLGTYTVDTSHGTTSTSPSIIAIPSVTGRPTIVAAHAIAPSPGELGQWRDDLAWLAARCSEANVIVTGDFNASLDNVMGLGPAVFGNCGDSAYKLSAASIGTWPASLPALIGTQIDHVFYSAEWMPIGITIDMDSSAALSDHRPVVVTLVPAS